MSGAARAASDAASDSPSDPEPDDDPRLGPLVDRLFRDEAGRLTALLTRLLGPAHLALAEDVVQEAFVAALGHWPRTGVPAQPAAWLLQVARRKALDALRRERAFDDRAPLIAAELDAAVEGAAHQGWSAADAATSTTDSTHTRHPTRATRTTAGADGDPFADDRLRMMLLCCHPAVSADSRVALTLKLVSGFGVGEIARAFLADERAIAQRLVRAKRALREADASFALPEGDALAARLDAVLDVLYLMFNEAHTAHAGASLVREELAAEALRLVERLARHRETASPAVHALAALFCLHASRFAARTDADGTPLRLAEQDRSRWDAALIARGFMHLERAAAGERETAWHVEAEIASVHAIAPSWFLTDWARIVAAYDRLVAISRSPVVALNRVVAIRELRGAEAAWRELTPLVRSGALDEYPLLHAVRGALLSERDRPDEARAAWQRARELTASAAMQRQVDQRLDELAPSVPPTNVDPAARRPS